MFAFLPLKCCSFVFIFNNSNRVNIKILRNNSPVYFSKYSSTERPYSGLGLLEKKAILSFQ